jgi:uncharacterized membrane protein YjjB (DUF3815 family)
VCTFIATLLDKFVYNENLCLYGQLFGGIVWQLPGITITIAVLELYSNMIVYGSSRLMYGISLATQLGLGLSGGYRLVYTERDLPDSFENGCKHEVNDAFGFILLPLAAVGLGVLINATHRQLPGMVLCCGTGQLLSFLINRLEAANDSFVPLVASFGVTTVARIYAYYLKERPLVYILCGLLVLVPGGMGVKGSSSMFSGDVKSGLEFTFQMVLIGVVLAIGVFLALLPRKSWFCSNVRTNKDNNRVGRDNILVKSLITSLSRNKANHLYGPSELVKECDV